MAELKVRKVAFGNFRVLFIYLFIFIFIYLYIYIFLNFILNIDPKILGYTESFFLFFLNLFTPAG